MPAIETTISTERPQRYLKQFSQHAAAMAGDHAGHRSRHTGHEPSTGRPELRVDASDQRTLLTFTPWGRCTLTSQPGELHIRIEATDNAGLDQIQKIITSDLQRFVHRDHLRPEWSTTD